jgi:hypothetical protein
MIIQERELHFDTRDVAPRLGDPVQRPALGRETHVIRAVAHWPLLGMWEVDVAGARKPEITITVAAVSVGVWREVSGR